MKFQASRGYVKIVVGLVPQIRLLSLGTRNSNVLKVITVIIIDLIKFSNVLY